MIGLMFAPRVRRSVCAFLAVLLSAQCALTPLLAAQLPGTWQHVKNLPVNIREEGFFRGLTVWLKEDWRMTVADTAKVAGAIQKGFRAARASLGRLRARSRAEVVAAAHLPEVAAQMAALVDNLDCAQLAEAAGVPVADEATEQVVRARLKRDVMAASEEGARMLQTMSPAELERTVAQAEAALAVAEDQPAAPPPGAKASGILPRVAPRVLSHLMPKKWADFMFSDNAWLAMLPTHMLLCGVIIQSTAGLTGAAGGAAILLTSLFAVGGISVSWGLLAVGGTAAVLSTKFIKWLVSCRRAGGRPPAR